MPVVDFNPVDKYIQELREIYGEYAVFFHDCYGGNVIGILWNKHVLEPRDFKVLHVNAKKLINGKLTINYDVILEDIYNRGYGLIKSIEKNVII
ncbi:nucleolar rna-associated protein [Holotrichia oblita]|nr:nucleolar rna-associated protein [Holotrichia oblita]